jgi:hypothetical protein
LQSTHPERFSPRRARLSVRNLFAGGTTGNEVLTAVTGALLIVLLAVIGVTIVRIGSLLWVHLFVGMLLIGPLALKLASTGYRFVCYYTGNRRYRRKGAPWTPLRLIAPVVVVSTVIVMASGVALLLVGPGSRGALLPIHKASFIVWIAFTALHVLAHLPDTWNGLTAEYGSPTRSGQAAAGRAGRTLSLASALVLGTVIAILVIPQFSPWLHAHLHHHH